MTILGISCFYHDSAAALVRDGAIVAAAQEERFSRKKHDAGFPTHAIEYCLREASLTMAEVDYVVFYDKPLMKFERILQTSLAFAPAGIRPFMMAIPLWMKEKLWIPSVIRKNLSYDGPVLFTEHHESHAASAFFPSPFESAAFLTIDGVGEWATTTFGVGRGNTIDIHSELNFPHSLGLLYSAFTYFTGFKVNSAEYKVMGLAPYGEPVYVRAILDHLIDLKPDGSFRMDMRYFNYCAGLTMTSPAFDALFDGPPRIPESPLTQREMNLARSLQEVTEEIMLRMARHVHAVTGEKHLVLAGGVALNCVGNGRILREGPFERIWIQPASGDAGGALGAALSVWHSYLGHPRTAGGARDTQKGSYLGPSFGDQEIEAFLTSEGIPFERLTRGTLAPAVAELLAREQVVGWFQGRMEFGPRALGARSILGDARSPAMQAVMNVKIKFRESFRPFAPSVLAERASEWFGLAGESPYMLLVAPVAEERRRPMTPDEDRLFGIDKLNIVRSEIPAVTHVDYSARVQTVHPDDNPLYHELLCEFERLTGCPVIINTSFNVRGEPIVCRPEEAYACFMRTNMDYLVLGSFLLAKSAQEPAKEGSAWQKEYELD